MVITGTDGNPFYTLCRQLDAELHPLSNECPIYNKETVIAKDTDSYVEQFFNSTLNKTSKLNTPALKAEDKDVPVIYGDKDSVIREKPFDVLKDGKKNAASCLFFFFFFW